MGTSVFPEVHAGGLEVRDAAGNPVYPPGVEQAYSPLPPFTSTCPITALPSDCTARIEPRQINAIVSELISFAECLNATGPWDCNSLQNLCTAFTAWALINVTGVIVSDTAPVGVKDSVMWWESDTGNLYINYNDGNTTQWVQIAGTPVFDNISIIGVGTESSPHEVGLVDCGTY